MEVAAVTPPQQQRQRYDTNDGVGAEKANDNCNHFYCYFPVLCPYAGFTVNKIHLFAVDLSLTPSHCTDYTSLSNTHTHGQTYPLLENLFREVFDDDELALFTLLKTDCIQRFSRLQSND